MGRVKLQMKRLENAANRQVTFSKRRNRFIKKVYELSVLCDVDVALVMFSPAERFSLFSGNKSIEDILTRYVNLPRHKRERLHNEKHSQKAKHRSNVSDNQSPVSGDSEHVKEIQQEILKCKSQMEEVKNRLRIFEGDLSKITTLPEVEMHEQILEETLNRLHMRKVHLPPSVDELVVSPGSCTTQPTYLDPQVEILNFLSANGLLPLSDDQVLQPPTTVTPNKFESGNNNS